MERWDGSIIDINATCNELGPKCLQLLGMHALSGCDTVSYPFNKGKVAALNVLKASNFPNMFDTLGEEGVSPDSVRETGRQFFAAFYGQPSTVTMNGARHRIYTRKKGSLSASWPCSNRWQSGLSCHASTSPNEIVEGCWQRRSSKFGHYQVWVDDKRWGPITFFLDCLSSSPWSNWCTKQWL